MVMVVVVVVVVVMVKMVVQVMVVVLKVVVIPWIFHHEVVGVSDDAALFLDTSLGANPGDRLSQPRQTSLPTNVSIGL